MVRAWGRIVAAHQLHAYHRNPMCLCTYAPPRGCCVACCQLIGIEWGGGREGDGVVIFFHAGVGSSASAVFRACGRPLTTVAAKKRGMHLARPHHSDVGQTGADVLCFLAPRLLVDFLYPSRSVGVSGLPSWPELFLFSRAFP